MADIQKEVLAGSSVVGLGWMNQLMPAVYIVLIFSLIGIPLIPLIAIWLRFLLKKQDRMVREHGLFVFKKFVGDQAKYIDVVTGAWKQGGNRVVPTGIATDGSNIYVMDDGVGAKIPWDQVRNWRWGTESAAVRYGRIGFGALEDGAENAVAEQRAAKNSGFFVSVSDVEKPEWQFMTKDETLLKKWMEIFTQIDEGAFA